MTISELAARLFQARESVRPFSLLLGAGASIASGIKKNDEVIDDVLKSFKDDWRSEDPKLENLERIWKNRPAFRAEFVHEYFEGKEPSPGYRSLARLVRD